MKAVTAATFRVARAWGAWLMLCVLAGGAWAQAVVPPPAVGDHAKAGGPQQQRRAALRAALKAQRNAEAPKPELPVRQLTPAERAKLREQLRDQRQQLREGQPARNG